MPPYDDGHMNVRDYLILEYRLRNEQNVTACATYILIHAKVLQEVVHLPVKTVQWSGFISLLCFTQKSSFWMHDFFCLCYSSCLFCVPYSFGMSNDEK